jgi:hypothetical protein
MTTRIFAIPRFKINDFREFQKYFCSFCGIELTEDGSVLFRGVGACPRHLREFRRATENFTKAKKAARI